MSDNNEDNDNLANGIWTVALMLATGTGLILIGLGVNPLLSFGIGIISILFWMFIILAILKFNEH